MEGSNWVALMKSVKDFLKVRSADGSPDDRASIVYFSSDASIVVANSPVCPALISELPPQTGGGTNYSEALQKVIQIMSQKNDSNLKYGIVFMSGGEAGYPDTEIKSIKANYLDLIYKFWTIGYGESNDFSILKQICRELYGNEEFFKNPTDPIILQNAYVEIARDDNK